MTCRVTHVLTLLKRCLPVSFAAEERRDIACALVRLCIKVLVSLRAHTMDARFTSAILIR